MQENRNDQKVQGNQNDQQRKENPTNQSNYGKESVTNNPNQQNRDDWKETPQNRENENRQGNTDNSQTTGTETGNNAGIQNQGYTGTKPQEGKDTGEVNNLNDDDNEEQKELEDLEHPHKTDMPTATGNGIDDGAQDLEVEEQDRRGITNQGEEKIY